MFLLNCFVEKIQNLEHSLSEAKLNEEKAHLDFREKEIELAALRKYFKDTESDLHRKLTAEESAREATENKLKTELSKATADSKDLNTYKYVTPRHKMFIYPSPSPIPPTTLIIS